MVDFSKRSQTEQAQNALIFIAISQNATPRQTPASLNMVLAALQKTWEHIAKIKIIVV